MWGFDSDTHQRRFEYGQCLYSHILNLFALCSQTAPDNHKGQACQWEKPFQHLWFKSKAQKASECTSPCPFHLFPRWRASCQTFQFIFCHLSSICWSILPQKAPDEMLQWPDGIVADAVPGVFGNKCTFWRAFNSLDWNHFKVVLVRFNHPTYRSTN